MFNWEARCDGNSQPSLQVPTQKKNRSSSLFRTCVVVAGDDHMIRRRAPKD